MGLFSGLMTALATLRPRKVPERSCDQSPVPVPMQIEMPAGAEVEPKFEAHGSEELDFDTAPRTKPGRSRRTAEKAERRDLERLRPTTPRNKAARRHALMNAMDSAGFIDEDALEDALEAAA